MNLKVNPSLHLTSEQVIEVGNVVMAEPDMGWNTDYDYKPLDNVYCVEMQGEHGKYFYRVNVKKELITLLEVY